MNRLRTSASHRTLLASAIALTLTAGQAQAAPLAAKLDKVTVEGTAPTEASSPKYTRPRIETPQTIDVVDRQLIEGQNLLSLQDVLATLPGITFGAGEGGGGFGDKLTLRGFNGDHDISVDGLRDSALYSRSDTFNLEQVELVNGANSVYSGAGSVGGNVNLVSKVARAGDFRRITAGIGSDSYGRATADINQQVNESSAFRLNAMVHRNDAPGRDVETFERWGVAPSLTLGLGSDTEVSFSYVHQYDDNVPQYGVPYYNGGPLDIVDRSDYFGYRNVDRQEIETDSFTARINHYFNDRLSLQNTTRQAEVEQTTVVDPPQGTYCLDSGISANGGSCVSGGITVAPGFYLPTGPRGNRRDTKNTLLVNQTDLLMDFATGTVQHNAVLGFSFSHETYDLLTGRVLRNADGSDPYAATGLPPMDIRHPDNFYPGPINYIPSSRQDGELDNRAIYAFDTLAFSPQWDLNLGLRYESNDSTNRTDSIATDGSVTAGEARNDDQNLFSYRAGLVYKPSDQLNLYLAYGNSETPSSASVNGGCTIDPVRARTSCGVDPESAINSELGAKWALYDGRLVLTAALSRNERENYRVNDPNNPANPSGVQTLDGRARVDAVLLGLYGKLSDGWAVYANYTHLDSEVLQGASSFDASQGADYTRGDRLTQVPEDAFNLWTTYDLNQEWQVGYGVTYQGKTRLTQHSESNPDGPLVTSDAYTVHRISATYQANRALSFQLNLSNLLDEEYYTRIRNNGWATPGDARQATLTAHYRF